MAVTQGGVVYTWGSGGQGRLGHVPMINGTSTTATTMESSARELVHLPAVTTNRQREVLHRWRRAHSIASHVHLLRAKGDEWSIREATTARLIQGAVLSSMHTQAEIAVVGGGNDYRQGQHTSLRDQHLEKRLAHRQDVVGRQVVKLQQQRKVQDEQRNVQENVWYGRRDSIENNRGFSSLGVKEAGKEAAEKAAEKVSEGGIGSLLNIGKTMDTPDDAGAVGVVAGAGGAGDDGGGEGEFMDKKGKLLRSVRTSSASSFGTMNSFKAETKGEVPDGTVRGGKGFGNSLVSTVPAQSIGNVALPGLTIEEEDPSGQEEEEKEMEDEEEEEEQPTVVATVAESGDMFDLHLQNPEQWHPYLEKFQLYGLLPPIPWIQSLLENETTDTRELTLVAMHRSILAAEIELTKMCIELELLFEECHTIDLNTKMILGAVIATVSPTPPNTSSVAASSSSSSSSLPKCASTNASTTFHYRTKDQTNLSIPATYKQHYTSSNNVLRSLTAGGGSSSSNNSSSNNSNNSPLALARILAILVTNPDYLIRMHLNLVMAKAVPARLLTSVWNKRTNSLRFVDAIIDLFDYGRDNGFLEHRLLVLMDQVLAVELPYLRKKSNNNFQLFASNYCFVVEEETDEEEEEEEEEEEDKSKTRSSHRNDVDHHLLFGRLFQHYMSKQCSDLIPLLSPFCRDILFKSKHDNYTIQWKLNQEEEEDGEGEGEEGKEKGKEKDDSQSTVDAMLDLYNHVYLHLANYLSLNTKWMLRQMHKRIAKEFDRDVHSNADVVADHELTKSTPAPFSQTGRRNDDDVCVLMATFVCERIVLPMLKDPFAYRLWNSEDRIECLREGTTSKMYTRGRQHLLTVGQMLVTFIAHNNDSSLPSRLSSVQQWQHLPPVLKWKAKESLTHTRRVVRAIVHTRQLDQKMECALKCDMYGVHLMLPREKRRPIGCITLSFLRRALRR